MIFHLQGYSFQCTGSDDERNDDFDDAAVDDNTNTTLIFLSGDNDCSLKASAAVGALLPGVRLLR